MVCGDVHVASGAVSIRHAKLDPVSVEEKLNVGVLRLVVPDGPLSIVVSGAVVSTVNERVAGVWSAFPARSVAQTSKVWRPSLSVPVVNGVEQSRAASVPSTRHLKLDRASFALNPNVAVLSVVVPDGPLSIVVCGATSSSSMTTAAPKE